MRRGPAAPGAVDEFDRFLYNGSCISERTGVPLLTAQSPVRTCVCVDPESHMCLTHAHARVCALHRMHARPAVLKHAQRDKLAHACLC